jgi:hypothetical protein
VQEKYPAVGAVERGKSLQLVYERGVIASGRCKREEYKMQYLQERVPVYIQW